MDIFEKLKTYAKMESEEDIRRFEVGVWSLAESKDPEILKKLIDLFDDDCPYYEVMYSLVHAVETYSDEVYVFGIIEKLESFLKNAPGWIDIIVNRIFNEPKCLEIFKNNMNFCPKYSLLKLFDLMEVESPHHQELIQFLRKEIENK